MAASAIISSSVVFFIVRESMRCVWIINHFQQCRYHNSKSRVLNYKLTKHNVCSHALSSDLTALWSFYIPQAMPSGCRMTLMQSSPCHVGKVLVVSVALELTLWKLRTQIVACVNVESGKDQTVDMVFVWCTKRKRSCSWVENPCGTISQCFLFNAEHTRSAHTSAMHKWWFR